MLKQTTVPNAKYSELLKENKQLKAAAKPPTELPQPVKVCFVYDHNYFFRAFEATTT